MRAADPAPLLRALDEAAFGPSRTLNLRESLPTAEAARKRAESWLRERQLSLGGDVLVVTGRGNKSVGGVSVVREAIVALLRTLQRQKVVKSWRQQSPGSFIATLHSAAAMFEAPQRSKDQKKRAPDVLPGQLSGLSDETLALLRNFATRSLQALGVDDVGPFLTGEMQSKFRLITAALGPKPSEESLKSAIRGALDEIEY